MATDTTLVKGAYDANKYRGQAVDAAQRRLGDNLNETVGKLAANKKAEKEAEAKAKEVAATDAAQKILDTDGAPTKEDNEFTRQHLENEKKKYLEAVDKNEPTEGIFQDLTNLTGIEASLKGAKFRLANNQLGKSVEGGEQTSGGFGLALERDPEAKAFFEGNMNPERITNEEGEVGVKGPDGEFMSVKAFEDKIASFEVDDKSFSSIRELAVTYKKQGADSNPEDPFDREEASNGIRDIVVNGANLSSLMNDPGFGGTSFIDDLRSGTIYNGGLTYTALGIPQIGDDNIVSESDELSEDDINVVVDAFVDPKNQDWNKKERQDMVIDYFTTHLERNYNKEHNKVLQKSFSVQPSFQLNSPTISQTLANRNQSPLNAGVAPNEMTPQDYINEQS
jgi:hypothetical protein